MNIAIAGMILAAVIVAMVGGFIMLYPVSRQLAAYLTNRLERGTVDATDEVLVAFRDQVHRLEATVDELQERQEFLERLVEGRGDTPELPPSSP